MSPDIAIEVAAATPRDPAPHSGSAPAPRMARRLVAVAIVLVASACAPTDARLGGFTVRWQESPAQLVVLAPDGRELLRTSGAPIASRAASADWEEQFGMFKPTEDDPPWHQGTTLSAAVGSNQVAFDFGGGRKITALSTRPGTLELRLEAPATDDRVRAQFVCAPSDHFLGFGSQSDAVDHRGHKIPIWISEPGIGKTNDDDIPPDDAAWMLHGARHAASYPLPTFLSNRGMAFLADTTRRTIFDVCQADPKAWSVETWDHAVTLRVYDGPTPAEAVERLTADIGRQPLANDLVLAPWNDAIFGSAHVREIADLLRANKIPSGAIWTEDFRGGVDEGDSYRLKEEWDVDRTLYPDIEALATELHQKGFRFLAYHNTFLVDGTHILQAARAAGVTIHQADGTEYDFTGASFQPTTMVDLTNPKGPAFVQSALEKLLSYGFDGWMSDYGEWLPADAKLAGGEDAEAVHNEYPRAYFAAAMAALKKANDPAHATIFSRSGCLRTAPLQPVVWAGDQWTNFMPDDGMPTVVTMGLNLGLGGIALYGHDIAGYQNGTFGPSTKETFFRWTEVGALSPVMRTHHGTKAHENWWFGKDADTLAHFKRWATLHARLWPYTRAAANEAFAHGMPMMRQLALAFPAEDRAWTLKDEYLFGPSLLVAPVLVEGATSRSVWLPPGQWMPFEGGAELAGPNDVTVDAPLTELPMFVRPGTIVPLLPDTLDTLMPAAPPLVDLDQLRNDRSLLLFAGANGQLTDLDGTKYALTSQSHDAPDAVLAPAALPACDATTTPCALFDPDHRQVTVRGEKMTKLSFQASGHQVASFAASGALDVSEVVYRY